MSDKQKKYEFFVDAKKYESPDESITGLQVKTIASVPGGYQLFLEEDGDKPDRAISDAEGVNLGGEHIRHFFAIPPATFGAE